MPAPRSPHGTGLRGLTLGVRSSTTEGRFGRLFRNLRAAEYDDAELSSLGFAMTADLEPARAAGGTFAADAPDGEENSAIASGYTYVGQFLDHDITFDPSSLNERIRDRDALTNFRTPRLDLDSVYGRGPDHQPYLYADDGIRMLLGAPLAGNGDDPSACDLPRNRTADGQPNRALLGDKRNDENRIVAQLHAGFLRFHNACVDLLRTGGGHPSFGEVRQFVVYHYQWAVLHDFLPTMVGPAMVHDVLPHIDLGDPTGDTSHYINQPKFRFYKPKHEPYMPLEFAVAAYRFGHAMIRPTYRLNAGIVASIFDVAGDGVPDLGGFRPIPNGFAIDWDRFFGPATPGKRLQPAYKIDTSLVHPLTHLPGFRGDPPPTLASRNLRRARELGLPSGQDVARAMGEAALADVDIRIGKAAAGEFGDSITALHRTVFNAEHNHDVSGVVIGGAFAGRCPLWVYILAEGMQDTIRVSERPGVTEDEVNATATLLGPVGGRIITEVIAGLILEDSSSYLRVDPLFLPDQRLCRADGTFGFKELLAFARNA